jgi:hypothetical protein
LIELQRAIEVHEIQAEVVEAFNPEVLAGVVVPVDVRVVVDVLVVLDESDVLVDVLVARLVLVPDPTVDALTVVMHDLFKRYCVTSV